MFKSTLVTADNFDKVFSYLKSKTKKNGNIVAIDTETNGLFPRKDWAVGFSFAVDTVRGFYVATGHRDADNELFDNNLPVEQYTALLEYIAECNTIFHNCFFDIPIIKHTYGVLMHAYADTMILAYASSKEFIGLKKLAKAEIGYEQKSFQELLKETFGRSWKKLGYNFGHLTPEQAVEYASDDAVVTLSLYKGLREEALEVSPTVVYLESLLIPVMLKMNNLGVPIDVSVLEEQTERLRALTDSIEQEIYVLAGEEFKINSSAQCNDLLFNTLGLPVIKRSNKTGEPSFDKEVQEELAEVHPIVPKISEWKSYTKLLSAYLEKLPKTVEKGRVWTNFGSIGSASGRFTSSSMPMHNGLSMGLNMQNIPRLKYDSEGEVIDVRRAFSAKKGYTWVKADYSQIEYRLMANIAQEAYLIDSFRDGVDFHTLTASIMYRVHLEDVTKELRAKGKTLNFGLSYGMGAPKLAKKIGTTRAEAQTLIANYFKQLQNVVALKESAKELAINSNITRTFFGRTRKLKLDKFYVRKDKQAKEGELRRAFNIIVQGSAADFLKMAMIRVHYMVKAKYRKKVQMVLTVHDELDFVVKNDVLEEFLIDLKLAMEMPVPDDWCTVKIDIETGKSWSSVDLNEVVVDVPEDRVEKFTSWRNIFDGYVPVDVIEGARKWNE